MRKHCACLTTHRALSKVTSIAESKPDIDGNLTGQIDLETATVTTSLKTQTRMASSNRSKRTRGRTRDPISSLATIIYDYVTATIHTTRGDGCAKIIGVRASDRF